MRASVKRQTTLTDIARIAGVAPMTVSRVVNGNGYVSAELRSRIEQTIERLNYSPNRLARSLKGTPTGVIGILVPDLAHPFNAELARDIEEALAEDGYYAFLVTAGSRGRSEKTAMEALSDH